MPARGAATKRARSPVTAAAAEPAKKRKTATGAVAVTATRKVDPDLPFNEKGEIYHLACATKDVANRFIFVGDPGRVAVVAAYFDKGSITFTGSHREINITTGKYKGKPVTVLSTGMGTDNVEIVMNEIHALHEFDYPSGKWATKPADVAIIRVGTCGCPQGTVNVGSLAISRHAIGMDNTCRYYIDAKKDAGAVSLQKAMDATGFSKIGVYTSRAHPDVTRALIASAAKICKSKRDAIVGATASGSGFYGCQGRIVGRFKGRVTLPNLVDILGGVRFQVPVEEGIVNFGATAPAAPATTGKGSKGKPAAATAASKFEEERVVNIEMENSAICTLSNILGYRAGTVCCIVATRAGEKRAFATPDQAKSGLADAILVALDALISL